MSKLLSDQTASRMLNSIQVTENLTSQTRAPKRRIVRQRRASGGGTRSYVIITSFIDAENYIGNVITSPFDSTIITPDVKIVVKDGTTNAFDVGYTNFADLTTFTDGTERYMLDGYLLG
ncbi:MAG: hypothetical protein V3U78_09970 [Thiotrichaceae bacterium]